MTSALPSSVPPAKPAPPGAHVAAPAVAPTSPYHATSAPPGAHVSTPVPAPLGGSTTPPVQSLSQTQNNALALLTSTLHSWGLDGLVSDLKGLIVAGDTNPDTLSLALSQTAAYKTRFAANDVRIKNGLPALTPAQYIATEESYKQILQSYGLPSGFYDSNKDFEDFIGKDISPTELDARAKIAHDQYQNAPAYVKNLWQQYGFSKGDAIAGILDPTVATSVIQDRAQQIAIGGSAAAQGLSVSQQRAQQLAQAGVTSSQAQQGYGQISQAMPVDQAIANRFHAQFGLADEENSVLLGQGAEVNKRQTLYDEEQALFKTHGNADANTLGVSQSY